jgi:ABC-type dipeptide/oligopeptide/nickel transport system permease component
VKLWVYIVRRLLLMVPVLLGVVTLTFIIISGIPTTERLLACHPPGKSGYPSQGSPGWNNLLAQCGLSGSVLTQYGSYVYNTFTLHWGYVSNDSSVQRAVPQIGACYQLTASSSLTNGGSNASTSQCAVMTLVEAWLPYTMELAALSLVLIMLLAIPLGNYSAVYRNRPFDQGTRIFSFTGFAIPGYLLGGLLIIAVYLALSASGGKPCDGSALNQILGSWHGSDTQGVIATCYPPAWVSQTTGVSGRPPFANGLWGTSPTGFPTLDAVIYAASHPAPAGYPSSYLWDLALDHVLRLVIPALTIAYGTVAGLLRFVRNSMLEVMNLDFIRTARSKGVPERRVISQHAGRNSLNVTVTVLGLTFAGFLGGFAVTESLFGLFGVGSLFAYALLSPIDVGTIFASTVLFTIIIVVANMIVDVVYGYLDPRVRLG